MSSFLCAEIDKSRKKTPNRTWLAAHWLDVKHYTADTHSPRNLAKACCSLLVYLPTTQTDWALLNHRHPEVNRHVLFVF